MKIFFKKIITTILRVEAKLVIKKYQPKIIAITGSVGKTSTKDAVFAVFSGFTYVRKSEKSFNSEIGLPLTILGCPNGWDSPYLWFKNILKGLLLLIFRKKYPEWLILEVGIGKPGDMQKTASWLLTDAVIITAIGETPAHIEFFESKKQLIEEKSKLIKTLKPEGLLVLNADDSVVLEMKNKTRNRTITYGFQNGADLIGNGESILYDQSEKPTGIIFRVDEDATSLPVVIEGVFGKNHIYAALASLALIKGLKFNLITAINQLKNYEVPPGRMRLLNGIKNSLIIDDSYNSSPYACESALNTLNEIKNIRKIAVLGDMLELGKHTQEAHFKIGQKAGQICQILITVGLRAEAIAEGALSVGMQKENIYQFTNSKEAGEFLKKIIQNDLILVKGSQGMRMERVVASILSNQKEKARLLVRQETEWLKKE